LKVPSPWHWPILGFSQVLKLFSSIQIRPSGETSSSTRTPPELSRIARGVMFSKPTAAAAFSKPALKTKADR
jgi:hypothetical protein